MSSEELKQKFLAYWHDMAKNGEVSELDRLERLMVDYVTRWVAENYKVTEKRR